MAPKILKFNFQRSFGIELEFNANRALGDSYLHLSTMRDAIRGRDLDIPAEYYNGYTTTYSRDNFWICKIDTSCGYEIASPVLKTAKDLKTLEKVLQRIETQCNLPISDNCGQHIHIGIDDFNHEQAKNLFYYWIKLEKCFISTAPRHRQDNRYCRQINNLTSIKSSSENYDHTTANLIYERAAINMNNFLTRPERRTVEFRFGEMTYNAQIIKNKIRLLVLFVEICKNLPKPSNLNWLGPKAAIEFLCLNNDEDCILSDAMREAKIYFLESMKQYSTIEKIKNQASELLALELGETI